MHHGLGESDSELDEYDHNSCLKNTLTRLSEYFDHHVLKKRLAETNEEFFGNKFGIKKKSEPNIFNRNKSVANNDIKQDSGGIRNKFKLPKASSTKGEPIAGEEMIREIISNNKRDILNKKIEVEGRNT